MNILGMSSHQVHLIAINLTRMSSLPQCLTKETAAQEIVYLTDVAPLISLF